MIQEIWSLLTYTHGHSQPVFAIAPLVLAAIMAAAGAIKGETVDKDKEARQRKLAAETARYSPWTGMTPGPIQEHDTLGNAMSFGLSGYGLGQNIQNADYQKFGQSGWGSGQAVSPYAPTYAGYQAYNR